MEHLLNCIKEPTVCHKCFEEFKKASVKSGAIRYLKGLGSLSLEDWDYVMKNKKITILTEDKKTKYHLDMAFGKSSMERKKWLSASF